VEAGDYVGIFYVNLFRFAAHSAAVRYLGACPVLGRR
jgi:hypothetical protein